MDDNTIAILSECCDAPCELKLVKGYQTWAVCSKCGKLICDLATPKDTHVDRQFTEIEGGVEYDESIDGRSVPMEVYTFSHHGVSAELCAGTTVGMEDKPVLVLRIRPGREFPLRVRANGLDGKHFGSQQVSLVELLIEGNDPYIVLSDLLSFGSIRLDDTPEWEADQQ